MTVIKSYLSSLNSSFLIMWHNSAWVKWPVTAIIALWSERGSSSAEAAWTWLLLLHEGHASKTTQKTLTGGAQGGPFILGWREHPPKWVLWWTERWYYLASWSSGSGNWLQSTVVSEVFWQFCCRPGRREFSRRINTSDICFQPST